jgi:hypothetical protein
LLNACAVAARSAASPIASRDIGSLVICSLTGKGDRGCCRENRTEAKPREHVVSSCCRVARLIPNRTTDLFDASAVHIVRSPQSRTLCPSPQGRVGANRPASR